jgi:mycothiol synthase
MSLLPEAARTEDWAAALRHIFQYLRTEERENRCANALRLLQRGELDPQGLFIVRGPASQRGAILCLPIPGRSALLWPPGVMGDRPTETEDALMQHACAWLRQRGVKLVQTLLSPEEMRFNDPLLRNGFSLVTHLLYMRHDLHLPVDCLNVPSRLDYQTFADDVLFRQTLLRTYEGSLDCPEVNGVRSIEDVIEGHRAQGDFDPERWWLVHEGKQPVGVLMMTEIPESGDWELAYMGMVPEARRRGFGREMLLHALCEARGSGVPTVTLSVDARNGPANNLYRSLGFEPYDWREVYLAFFG